MTGAVRSRLIGEFRPPIRYADEGLRGTVRGLMENSRKKTLKADNTRMFSNVALVFLSVLFCIAATLS